MVWGKKDHRPPGKKGKVVWKDPNAKALHDATVHKILCTPVYLNSLDPSNEMMNFLARGAGFSYVMNVPYIEGYSRENRDAPILSAAHWLKTGDQFNGVKGFNVGTLALYLGQIRSTERRAGVDVQAIRHLFVVGGERWIIIDLGDDELVPMEMWNKSDVI